ncbi:type IV pilus twitching motility protein PilT [Bacillaceae bacterium Marseille-Q3522]|nr:type IV pilus twitching motility protein PilT [Bacillaceae bacterium Marseille-Q3522]
MKEKIEEMLRKSYEADASDLHLSVGVSPIMRINGELKKYGTDILTPADTEAIAKLVIPAKSWEGWKEKGEVDFSYGLHGISRFRVNVYLQRGCVSLAFRVIPAKIPTIDELFLPNSLKKIVEMPHGLILVTGPTGSGKSTTLAAMIHHMNRTMAKRVITLEDPIEYVHKHDKSIIDQREVGFDTSNFASGLRAALRQDPDVILVGELRDLETIQTAITAAETGHLVLGTLHTSSAPATINRIIDVFPAEKQPQIKIQLASELAAIISQRLVQTIDRKRRIAATEILINNPAIGNLIRNDKVHQIISVMQTSRATGMHTLAMSFAKLIKGGIISRDMARLYGLE